MKDKIRFNFCEDDLPPKDGCTDTDAFAFITDITTNKCFGLRSEDDKIDTTGTELYDNDGVINGVSLEYVGGKDTCLSNSSDTYSLRINITCKADDDALTFVSYEGTSCHPQLNYLSKKGCAVFTMDAFTQFMDKYYYLWGAGLIVLGIFLCFFGNRFVNAVIFTVVGVGVFLILGSLFFYLFLGKVKEDWAKWLSLAAIIVVSLGLGFLVMRLRKWGIAIVAAWGGVMLGFVLTTAFVVENKWAYYAILIGCGAACFFVAFKIETTVVIIITGFVGAYALVRGVSLYAGGFPSETQLHDEIASGAVTWATFDKTFYIYLGAIVVGSIVGVWFQFRHENSLKNSLHQLKRPIK